MIADKEASFYFSLYIKCKTSILNIIWHQKQQMFYEKKSKKKEKERKILLLYNKKETYFLFIPFQSWRMKVGRQPLEDPSSQETAGRDFWIRCEYNLQWSRVRVCLLFPAASETILLTVKHWTQTKWLGYEY